jgi:hypothetical protein
MAIIQYLSGYQAINLLIEAYTGLSSKLYCGSSSAQTLTVSLWWTPNALPDLNTNASLVTSLDANGYPSVVAGWTEIQYPFGKATFTTPSGSGLSYYDFSGFKNLVAYLTGVNFAIVVGTSTVSTGQSVLFKSVSLVPGFIPTIPAPQTPDEVLRECQYYYEQSYDSGTAPGSVTTVGQRYALNELGTRHISAALTEDEVYLQSFSLTYLVPKRTIVNPVLYSPALLTAGYVQGRVLRNGVDVVPSGGGVIGSSPANYLFATYWAYTGASTQGTFVRCTDTTTKVYQSGSGTLGQDGDESLILYHYVADARLGIV